MRIIQGLFILLNLPFLLLAQEKAFFDDYNATTQNNILVSKRTVQDLLLNTFGPMNITEVAHWNGKQDQNGYAKGTGRLTLKTLLTEAGGLRRFQKEIYMDGLMKQGRFHSEVRIIVTQPSGVHTEIKTAYTDGLVVLTSKAEFNAFKRLVLSEDARVRSEIARLKSLKSRQEQHEYVLNILADSIQHIQNTNVQKELAKVHRHLKEQEPSLPIEMGKAVGYGILANSLTEIIKKYGSKIARHPSMKVLYRAAKILIFKKA